MTKEQLYKSWFLTNLIGSIFIILIIFFANLILDQIDVDSRRLSQVVFGVFIFFLFGTLFTFPHFIYSHRIIRGKYEPKKLWRKIWITMLVPYVLLITVVVAMNSILYGNPIFETPNLLFLGILMIHFVVGFFVWRYFQKKTLT